MTELEGTESSFVKRKIATSVENIKIGRVQQVFEHSANDDYSNFEVDVKILGEDTQHRSIPYQTRTNNEITVPTAGDKVVVEYRDGHVKQPIAKNTVYTNEDTAPLGKAGIWRKRIPSGDSPAGSGDLYVESYTNYDIDPSKVNPDDGGTPEESWVRIAKKANDDDEESLPVNIEFLDEPNNDEAHVVVELNKDDGADSTETWGLKFDLKTGEVKLLDPEGYGIVSDGSGNFTWHHEAVDFSEGTTTSL